MFIDRIATLTGIALMTVFLAAPAGALTMAQCSTKYNTAKDAGTLAGQTWNQFRKAECGSDASADAVETKASADPAKSDPAKSDAGKSDAGKTVAAETATRLTHKECGAKYQAAKADGTLNGLKWNDFRRSECSAETSAEAAAKPARAATTTAAAAGAKGLTLKECGAKYQAAKAAGTLNGTKWADFRKSECAAGTSAEADIGHAATAKATNTIAADHAKGLTLKQCGVKYQAAKAAGTLNGLKWNDFRKSECAAGTSAEAGHAATAKATNTAAADGAKGLTLKQCGVKYQAAKAAGTLDGMNWNDFRKKECGTGA